MPNPIFNSSTYENWSHENRNRTRECPSGEPDEHTYDTLPHHRGRNSICCQIGWLSASILLCVCVVSLTLYDIFFISTPACHCTSQQNRTPVSMLKLPDQAIRLTHASAHRRLYQPPETEEEGTFYSAKGTRTLRLDPNINDPILEHASGVLVKREGLVVQYPGLYYVYSSVHYKPSARHDLENCETQTWLHYVFRLSPDIPDNTGMLLQTIYSACGMCQNNSGTAFTGGVFHLKNEDFIQVEASEPSMVDYGNVSTYIGLMMLTSDGQ